MYKALLLKARHCSYREGRHYVWETAKKTTVLELEPAIEAEWIYTTAAIYPEQRLGTIL